MSTEKFAIIMPWGRVGSNLVVSTLVQHCRIGIANEPTTGLRSRNRDPRVQFDVDRDQIRYLRNFPDIADFPLPKVRRRLSGMKLSHRSLISPMAAYATLRERGFRIIAMDRDNHVKTAISQIRAEQRAKSGDRAGSWTIPQGAATPGASNIPPALALGRARAFAAASAQMHAYLGHFFGDDVIKIRYEDLNADPQNVISGLAEALGLRMPAQFDLPHKKATADDLSRSVENWEDLRAAFAESEFAPLLG